MPRDDAEHAVDEFLALEVGELAEHHASTEVVVAVGVAARAAQRTLASDLDGEVRTIALENPAPPGNDTGLYQQHASKSAFIRGRRWERNDRDDQRSIEPDCRRAECP